MSIILHVRDDEKRYSVILNNTKKLVLGRSRSADITVDDSKVSGSHLQISLNQDGHTTIKDLETTNGTLINGSKMNETLIYIDDEVKIGEVLIWINRSKMTDQEKELHTKDDSGTKVNFINMEGENTSYENRTALNDLKEHHEKEITDDDFSQMNQDKIIKKIHPVQLKSDMRNRMRAKAEKINEEKNKMPDQLPSEIHYDLEQPTGNTKMIKVQRPKSLKEKKKGFKRRPNSENKEKPKILDKIIGFFKKDDSE